MLKNNPPTSYSPTGKFLHWVIAIIVITMLTVTYFLDDAPKEIQAFGFMLHKSFGLTVLSLMILRIIWILYRGKPPLPATIPLWEKALSRIVQYSFYVLVLAMPLSGWLMSTAANKAPNFFGLGTIPFPGVGVDKALSHLMKETHNTIAVVLWILVSLHVLGALKHHFIDKDNVLRSMWFKRKD